jgi:hypothetical protein
VITSPSRSAASIAAVSASMPLAISDTWGDPNTSPSRSSSRTWNGPLLVSMRVSQICSSIGRNSAKGGRYGRVTYTGSGTSYS